MDSPDCTLNILRYIVGFSGLRDFNDLGKMRLDTLHSRIRAVNKRLSRYNVISMCIIWLQTKALQTPFSTLPIETWCTSWANQRCNEEDVLNFWKYSLENIWLYHQRCDPGSRKIMTRLYEEIKSHLCRGQPSPNKKQAGGSGSYPQDAFLGKTMDNHWEPPPPVVKHSVAAVGCAEKTIKLGWEPGESRDGVSTHQTAKLCLDRTELLKKRTSELVHLDETPGQEKEAHDQAAQKEGILNNLEASKAPGGLSLTKPLAKDICRRCHTAGHAISDCPTINDSSWDPPPHPRYICAICGVSGSHYVWDCEWRRPNTQWSTYSKRNQFATEKNTQVPSQVSPHPAEVMRGYFLTKPTPTKHCDDFLPSVNMEQSKLALRPGVRDGLDCGPQSRPRMSIESEKSRQWSIPRHEDNCDSLDEERDATKTVDNEAGEVPCQTADDFLSRFGLALKRKFYQKTSPEELISLENEPMTKKLKTGLEDGEVLDGSHSPSLLTSRIPIPGANDKDGSSVPEPQPGGPESTESMNPASRLGRSPSVHDLFPNREWEHTTHEARQTAMELWQSSSDNIELTTGAENEAPLVAVKLEDSHGAIDHSIAIEGNKNGAAAGGIAGGEEDDSISSVTSLSGSNKQREECDDIWHVAACQLHHHNGEAIYFASMEVKQIGDTADPLVAAEDKSDAAVVGAVEEKEEGSASATKALVAGEEDRGRSSIGHIIADNLQRSNVAIQPLDVEAKQDGSGCELCEHIEVLG
ncbi:Acyl-CoA N-acyltransferase [Metarhizium robertsii ARSEF 23]|uniref:Acyl-CoA N-acyltransferase n=1 Tax=Metarhizium robertsii (strain ARSEF 23 / ATCC MYA-3075) TaxID=655844 RepID=A0A0B2XEB6_METRA|nr:Acyl-CoA N-acyltransferase [Metarhizium robertsii ARSEF 23]KHO11065.1 Acyl-CoA N-acyltransferase [Metarhizium robertsii ARSEF 23]